VSFVGRYVTNFRPRVAYKTHKGALNRCAANILNRLRRDGIAITDVCELLISQPLFEELQRAIAQPKWNRLSQSTRRDHKRTDRAFKSYLIELLGPKPVLNPADVFVRFGLQPAICASYPTTISGCIRA